VELRDEVETLGLVPMVCVAPPPTQTFRLTWAERVSLSVAALLISSTCFFGSYEVKCALGINLVPGYHLSDVLPFYPRRY
jgi:hypothetical protein